MEAKFDVWFRLTCKKKQRAWDQSVAKLKPFVKACYRLAFITSFTFDNQTLSQFSLRLVIVLVFV